MNIILSDQGTQFKNQIILGSDISDFDKYIQDHNQGEFINERLKNKKETSILIDNKDVKLIQLIKNTDKPLHDDLENARRKAFDLYPTIKDYNLNQFSLINAGVKADLVIAFIEGLYMSNYQFLKYFSRKKESQFEISEISIISEALTDERILNLSAVLEGNAFSRDLVNEPLSFLNATKLSEEILKKAKETGFTIDVFNKKKIESLRMGGLLAVNKGSIDPPTFSILEWKPENSVNKKPVVLVGKGIVYDTGGLSLKPTQDSMDYMKCDMAGAAAVAGTFYAIAKAKIPVHIIGLIPATDNRPDGNAYVPGDVIKMYNGSTVEVLNTDAEGRMILADALSYASHYEPELVIELSTLTGAAHAAVGNYAIVGMGNTDPAIMEELKQSGFRTHERIAEFPFWEDFAELLNSDIADMKNIGGKFAGAITAGKFLEKFTNYPFIHLDIAGPSFNKSKDNYRGIGGSGIGVRLLFDFLTGKAKGHQP